MALVTRCPIIYSQKILAEALRACKNKSVFALEQLERAACKAADVGVVESRELYNLGKAYLVRCSYSHSIRLLSSSETMLIYTLIHIPGHHYVVCFALL